MSLGRSRDGLKWHPAASDVLRGALGYTEGADAVLDSRGVTVRCTPMRRTVRIDVPGELAVFAKHRLHAGGLFRRGHRPPLDAMVLEREALLRLPEFGFDAPQPLFEARRGAETVFGMLEVAGCPADVAMDRARSHVEASGGRARDRDALDAVLGRWLETELGPRVRAMHAAGSVYRDLYLNHVFVGGLRPVVGERVEVRSEDAARAVRVSGADFGPGAGIALIDAERLFSPKSMRRWLVKDLAGLASSWPRSLGEAPVELICVACGQESLTGEVTRKAQAIRAHRPKYG